MSIWTTDATHWSERNVRSVESIFHHHPNASLFIYSNHLAPSAVEPFASAGFDVKVVGYRLEALLEGTPAKPWLDKLASWEQGPYFYTHVTDVIRLALLFREGGVYVDTDVIIIRPFRIAEPEVVAAAIAEEDEARKQVAKEAAAARHAAAGGRLERIERLVHALPLNGAPPPLAPHSIGAEAHTISETPIVNGAIMVFARGSPFLWGAMREFARSYRDYEWGWNGPELLTRVRRRCPANVSVLPEERFYPFHWEEVETYSTDGHAAENEYMWRVVQARSYAAHLWNKKSNELPLGEGSVYKRLMDTYRVLPRAGGSGDGGALLREQAAKAHKQLAEGTAAGAIL
ncbi:nucleotide-diphospho-sugar transferase [Pavlovales sp. CCMP2436]|nr:nucleotide-diphospho-sugar transferase [Pavlovales sp. CCMP2436]